MLKSIGAAGLAALSLASAAPAQVAADDRAQVEDIVVTGRRSGVPLWTVRSEQTTLVLVGALQGVSKTTHWDPAALTEALRKADRVMFPQSQVTVAVLTLRSLAEPGGVLDGLEAAGFDIQGPAWK